MSDEEKQPNGAGQGENERLDQDIAEVAREIQVLHDKYLRAAADLDNFRKRARREQQEAVGFAVAAVLREMLPVLDNLERAMAAAQGAANEILLLEGVELIRRQFSSTLEKNGVKPIEAVGRRFDPQWHEAVGQARSDEVEEGTIVEEAERGYAIGERVLRPSKVIVAVGPQQEQ